MKKLVNQKYLLILVHYGNTFRELILLTLRGV